MNRQNLEVLLTRTPKLNHSMILYHGSMISSEVIYPLSINVGTRLTSARNSSFWTPNFYYAILIIVGRFINEITEPASNTYICDIPGNLIFYDQKYDEKIRRGLKNKTVFVHMIYYPVKKLGAGNSREQLEYSIDTPVKPLQIYPITYADYQSMLRPVPSEWYPEQQKHIMQKYDSENYNLLQKSIFYDMNEMKMRKRHIRKLEEL